MIKFEPKMGLSEGCELKAVEDREEGRKLHVKRERAGVGRQMRGRDRPEGKETARTANLSRNWDFQLEPGYRPSGDPSLPGLRVCLAQVPGAPSYPSSAKILAVVCRQNHNVHVMLIGFVRWRVEGLNEEV